MTSTFSIKTNSASRQVLWLLFGLLMSLSAYPQSAASQKKQQLQQQMQKLQDEIKLIQAALKKNSAAKEKSVSEILSLQAKIKSRERLIENINGQIGELDQSIEQTREEIEVKSREIEKMKADYASMLRKSYENLTLQNQVAFLFSSSSFYDAFRRYGYLLKIAEYRKGQAEALQQHIASLQQKEEELETTKEQKQSLLVKQTEQKKELEEEKKEKDAAVAKLQEKEKKLRKQIDEKNKAAQQLNARIKAIIEDEIRQAQKKAEKNPSTIAPAKKNEAMPMTAEEQALSKDFTTNRGKLPWPVAKGYVISEFGKHEHPALKGVMVENNGIDIKTEAGSDARAIFGGTVVSVFYLPSLQNCIIVKHGEYFTVYSGIETVNVKPEQTIAIKQSLGKLHTDKAENLTKVHLEIWKGKEKINPALWLAN